MKTTNYTCDIKGCGKKMGNSVDCHGATLNINTYDRNGERYLCSECFARFEKTLREALPRGGIE